jgi:hypothetical protein
VPRPAGKVRMTCRLVARESPESAAAARRDLGVPDPPAATEIIDSALAGDADSFGSATSLIAAIAAGYRKSWRRDRPSGGLTPADVEQEIWVRCLIALRRYRPERGNLEHYLRRVACNWVSNLKRDCGFSRRANAMRRNLANALPMGRLDISSDRVIFSSVAPCGDPADGIIAAEFRAFIEARLSAGDVDTFRRAISGERIGAAPLRRLRRLVRAAWEQWRV